MKRNAYSSAEGSNRSKEKRGGGGAGLHEEKIDVPSLKKRFFELRIKSSDLGPPWVHTSYKEFVEYFRDIPAEKRLKEHNFIVGAYFSYGWMPTMLRLGDDIAKALKALNNARDSEEQISEDEFLTIASVINGSVVGASKLLHFVCPDKYAIWDSRVYRFIFEKKPHRYRLRAPRVYQDYINALHVISSDKSFATTKIAVEKVVGYQLTDLRACELIMFANGKATKNIS